MNSFMNRRLPSALRTTGNKPASSWSEKLLSLLLIAASIALGLAAVSAAMQTFTGFAMPVRLSQPTEAATANAPTSVATSSAGSVQLPKGDAAAAQPTATTEAAAQTAVVQPSTTAKTAAQAAAAQPATTAQAAVVKPATTPQAAVQAAVVKPATTSQAVPQASDSRPKPQSFTEPNAEQIARLRRAAKVLDPEVMLQMPEVFDGAVKNPCWSAGDAFKCLPYVYITGMFHSGALSLADKLRMHPDIVMDACSNCQFWGEEGKPMGFYLDNMREGARMVRSDPARKVLLDSSPSTFAFYWAAGGKAHRGYADAMKPCYLKCVDTIHKEKTPVDVCMDRNCYNASLASDIKRAEAAGIDFDLEAHNPLLVRAVYGVRPPKMIVVVRDPIARLYSAFHGYPHYFGKYGKTSAGFTAYVKEQVGAFRTCAASYGERRCALLFEALGDREEKVYFHADQLMRGMYSLFLEIWYRFIPPSNWMVIHSDDLFNQPKPTLAKVVDFLGITKVNDTVLDLMVKAGKVNSYTSGQEPIQPEARKALTELYKPYNTHLAKLTGDVRYEKWNQHDGL